MNEKNYSASILLCLGKIYLMIVAKTINVVVAIVNSTTVVAFVKFDVVISCIEFT